MYILHTQLHAQKKSFQRKTVNGLAGYQKALL